MPLPRTVSASGVSGDATMHGRWSRDLQLAVLTTTFSIGAVALVWNMTSAYSAIGWMNIFGLEDFQSYGDVATFLRDLRVAVPPNLALLEIADYRLTGGTSFTLVFLYKAYVVVAYGCALMLGYPSRLRVVISGLLGLLFIFATTLIHPGNPTIYDVAAPCFFMLFALFLRIGTETSRRRVATAAIVLAGFFLSMFELSRAFVILMLPVILLFVYFRLGSFRRLGLFLIPLLLISGTWHANLGLRHRQLTASNHFGFNLYRCWMSQVPALPKLLAEADAPLAPGRWANLNNPQHLKNSLRIRRKIMRHIARKPRKSLRFMAERVAILTRGETAIYDHRPSHPLLSTYSGTVRATSTLTIVAFLWFAGRVLWLLGRRRAQLRSQLGSIDNLIIVVAVGSIFILAVGEAQEEARFAISFLPLLAAVPFVPHRFLRGRERSTP